MRRWWSRRQRRRWPNRSHRFGVVHQLPLSWCQSAFLANLNWLQPPWAFQSNTFVVHHTQRKRERKKERKTASNDMEASENPEKSKRILPECLWIPKECSKKIVKDPKESWRIEKNPRESFKIVKNPRECQRIFKNPSRMPLNPKRMLKKIVKDPKES